MNESGPGARHLPRHLHFAEVSSTMDAARQEVLNRGPHLDFLLVTAESQTEGRGTRGRPWISPPGNVYLTAAVHRRHLPPDRLALFPLEAGIALWDAVAPRLPPGAGANLRLKWPNDLLWEGRKTAGMLLEAASDHVFVGVGVNVTAAPPIADGGTPSACLIEAGAPDDCGLLIAKAFLQELETRLTRSTSSETLGDWRERALWNTPRRLRDRPGRPEVTPLEINAEGHLRVRFADGREEWLISEYLA
jgi:biotin-[acetyl-CoA-carboxylase] ligase BirA-like protein